MQALLKFAALLAVLALFAGCDDDPAGPETERLICGSVVDASGNPVADAGILLSYRPSFVDVLINPEKSPWQIINSVQPDSLPPPQWLKIIITRFCRQDTVRHFSIHAEGEFGIWDGTNESGETVTEGIYFASLVDSSGATTTYDIAVVYAWYDDASTADEREFFARTNAEGRFSFGQECLPFDYEFVTHDEHGDVIDTRTITRFVDLWAVTETPGVCAHVDSVYVDASNGLDQTIFLQ